jgi:hypothetical protein
MTAENSTTIPRIRSLCMASLQQEEFGCMSAPAPIVKASTFAHNQPTAGVQAGPEPLAGSSLQRFRQRGQSGPTFSAILIARSRCIFWPPTGRKLRAKIDASAAALDNSTPQDLQLGMSPIRSRHGSGSLSYRSGSYSALVNQSRLDHPR